MFQFPRRLNFGSRTFAKLAALQVEGDLQGGINSSHDIPLEFAFLFTEASLTDGSYLFANNNPVNSLSADAGRNWNMARVNPLLVFGIGYRTNTNDRTVLVERIPADHDNPSSASLFRALDGVEQGDEHITAKN
jgi:hypothetical protein